MRGAAVARLLVLRDLQQALCVSGAAGPDFASLCVAKPWGRAANSCRGGFISRRAGRGCGWTGASDPHPPCSAGLSVVQMKTLSNRRQRCESFELNL